MVEILAPQVGAKPLQRDHLGAIKKFLGLERIEIDSQEQFQLPLRIGNGHHPACRRGHQIPYTLEDASCGIKRKAEGLEIFRSFSIQEIGCEPESV
jgi:hypothetical protein